MWLRSALDEFVFEISSRGILLEYLRIFKRIVGHSFSDNTWVVFFSFSDMLDSLYRALSFMCLYRVSDPLYLYRMSSIYRGEFEQIRWRENLFQTLTIISSDVVRPLSFVTAVRSSNIKICCPYFLPCRTLTEWCLTPCFQPLSDLLFYAHAIA